jgi:hypothetical protein
MSPAEGIGGEAPTCSWRVDMGGSHDVDALAKRVSVISASEDGAFERHIKNVTTSRAECTMRGVPAKSHCELVIPLPEGAAARAVAVVSGSRTVELYAVRAPSYDRAYVKTVRASVVLPSSSETAGPSEDENARRRFECVAELGSVPCVALVLRLFVPSSGAAADQESTLGLRGVVVELKRRSSPTRGGGFPGAESAEARNPPMGSPLRLDALAAATRDVAGLPPGNLGMSGASAAAMLSMLRGMASGEGGGARERESAKTVSRDDDDSHSLGALASRVSRVESLLARFERGAFAAFDRIESRLEAFEARLDQLNAVRLGGEGRPPKAHTKREWDAGVRGDVLTDGERKNLPGRRARASA